MNNPNVPPTQQRGAPQPPHSSLSILSFVTGLIGFLAGVFPFAGLIGTVGLVVGIVDTRAVDPPHARQRHGFSIAGIVLGALATLGALAWGISATWLAVGVSRGSCPHLYAFDGETYRLDADLASGALYRGAEREDSDRLESLRAVDGQYRVRLQNDLEEIDNVDSLALLVVDAPEGVEVLPTPSGELVSVAGALGPTRAVDALGRDVLGLLGADDGQGVGVSRTAGLPERATRDSWTVELPRPPGASSRALLVLRARNTQFAEDAFIQYMAKMGHGVRPLLEMAAGSDEGCACYRQYMNEEVERLGLPLRVRVGAAGAAATPGRSALEPIGPATLRTLAVPIDLPPGDGPIVVELDATARFWEIDRVALAPPERAALDVRMLSPRSATTTRGDDALGLLAGSDQRRVVIRPGERVDVRFDAPPPPREGQRRTVVARLRGYYDLDIGGQQGVDPSWILGHRLGWTSLPEFARGLEPR